MPITTRGPDGRAEHGIENAELCAEAAQMRAQGLTYTQIGAVQDCDKSTASRRVQRALESIPAEAAEELRRLEEDRLDQMWAAAWELLTTDHVIMAATKDGTAIELGVDHELKLHAIDRLVRIQERRAKLRGLDAPSRKIVEVITEDVLDAEIRKLEEQLGSERIAVDHTNEGGV